MENEKLTKSDMNRKIDYDRYSLRNYYGPPIEKDCVEGRKYRYMLTIPHWLSEEQMTVILRTIAQFKEGEYPNNEGIELRIPKLPRNLFS